MVVLAIYRSTAAVLSSDLFGNSGSMMINIARKHQPFTAIDADQDAADMHALQSVKQKMQHTADISLIKAHQL